MQSPAAICKHMKLAKKIGAALVLALPSIALAQGTIIPTKPNGLPDVGGGGSGNLRDWVLYIINTYLLPLAGIIAVAFIIIGGYQYIFSGANEEMAEKGKKTLTNAVIGLVIIILSYVIVRIVARTLGAT